jgi:adenosylcobinamide-GDP ribazoletransferase
MVAGSVPWVGLVASTVTALVLATVAATWSADAGWWTGAVVVVAGLLGMAALLHRCLHQFGGVTGDVLGAVVETALAASLLAAVLLSPWAGAA